MLSTLMPRFLLLASAAAIVAAAPAPSYKVARSIPVPDGGWDYAKVDTEAGKPNSPDDQQRIVAFHLRLLNASGLTRSEGRRCNRVRRQQAGGHNGCTENPHKFLHKLWFLRALTHFYAP